MRQLGRSRGFLASALVFAVLTIALASASPAAGQTTRSCAVSSPGNYFDGITTGLDTGVVGSGAYVTTRTAGEYCTGGHTGNFASAWVMIASSGNDGYAQSGYDSALGSGTRTVPVYFAQAHHPGYAPDTWVGGTAPMNSQQLYYSIADWNCGCAQMYVGYANLVLQTSWNPYSDWSGSNPQYLQEASDPADNIFGSTSSRVAYTGRVVELPYLGSWTSTISSSTAINNGGNGGANWSAPSFTTCFDGYHCFETWSN